MRILHTSDWHIGRTLHHRTRHDEFAAFFDWLILTIDKYKIDVLLIAGDVFDSNMPSHQAQKLYYDFLNRVTTSYCRHVVLIGGNHDSPALLNAPQEVLKHLDVHVVGCMTQNLEDEIIILKNQKNQPEWMICAIPYLRDREIRRVELGENIEEKEIKLKNAIIKHYHDLANLAINKQASWEQAVPLCAMGHLFSEGGVTHEGDGVRQLYVGSLGHVPLETFPSAFNYVALGHLHTAQCVGKKEHIRYSGSPLIHSFNEIGKVKTVSILDWSNFPASPHPMHHAIPVPVFQNLEQLRGNLDEILEKIAYWITIQHKAWIEVIYTGHEPLKDIRQQIEEKLTLSNQLVLLHLKRDASNESPLLSLFSLKSLTSTNQTLHDLAVSDVFEHLLQTSKTPEERKPRMRELFKVICDKNALEPSLIVHE